MKHVFMIAGDASGDAHAAQLVTSLAQNTDIQFSGIGGSKMSKAGVDVFFDLAKSSVTGLTEVLLEFKDIKKAFDIAKDCFKKRPIDLLILVDYPGFNLRIAKIAKKHGIKILYYISPQIWAWKAKRIETIRQYVDVMAVILPFEKVIYQKENIKAYFVGHPLGTLKPATEKINSYKERFKLGESPVIGLLPGSRKNEIKYLLPIMLKAATELKAAHPNLSFVIPIAPTIKKELIDSYLDKTALEVTCVNGQMREVINCCHSAIVASGTACLEVALLQTPMAIIYKASPLTYAVAMKVIKMRYFGLCNLLAGKMVVPELLQTDLTPETIFEVMNRFLCDKTHYQKTKQELKLISKMLENNTADCTLGTLVLNMLTFSTKTTKEAAIRC